MSQGLNYLDTTGVYNGLTAANRINAALDALLTGNSGASAPVNALGGVPELGQTWLDTTSATLPVLKRYTGSAWVVEAIIDVANGIWIPVVGGGLGTVASATPNLGAQPQSVLNVTGTTTITSFGSSAAIGQQKTLIFGGILTLTYNATSLIIPGAASKVTAAGDVAIVIYLGSGNWRVLDYVPIVGVNVTSIAGNAGAFTLGDDLTNSVNIIKRNISYSRGMLSGLTLSAAGSTGTFGIALGTAADDAASGLMLLASAYTKTTAAWAVGTGNGGLDTSTIAINTWYHVYLIKRPDTGVVDVCISTSASAPTTGGNIPAAYTLSRRIGSMKTDGSSQWIKFAQVGDKFIWATTPAVVTASTSNSARANLVLNVPTGVVVNALFRAFVSTGNALFTSLLEADQAATATFNDMLVTAGLSTAGTVTGNFARLTDTSAQIGLRGQSTGNTVDVYVYGWEDSRGK